MLEATVLQLDPLRETLLPLARQRLLVLMELMPLLRPEVLVDLAVAEQTSAELVELDSRVVMVVLARRVLVTLAAVVEVALVVSLVELAIIPLVALVERVQLVR